MRVLVDTSVWSLALRRCKPVESPETTALAQLIEEGRVVMMGAIRQEILSGIRHPEQFERLRNALEAFPDELVQGADYEEAASIFNACLDAGVSTGHVDCLIAAVAMERGMEVLTTDQDFTLMSAVVPLRLYPIG